MVEPSKAVRVISTQPTQPIIDVTFWQHFTKLKLDVWKLTSPQVPIIGQVSLPNN